LSAPDQDGDPDPQLVWSVMGVTPQPPGAQACRANRSQRNASRRSRPSCDQPLEAEPGTIRGDLAVNIGRNVIHGSDSPETALFEIGLWFQPSELSDWAPSDQGWRVEG
jgi:hypothetical protein